MGHWYTGNTRRSLVRGLGHHGRHGAGRVGLGHQGEGHGVGLGRRERGHYVLQDHGGDVADRHGEDRDVKETEARSKSCSACLLLG